MTCDKCGRDGAFEYNYYRGKKTSEYTLPIDSRYKVISTYRFDTFPQGMMLCDGCIKKRCAAGTLLLFALLGASVGLFILSGRLRAEYIGLYALSKFIFGWGALYTFGSLIARLRYLKKERLYIDYARKYVKERAKLLPENREYDTFMTPEEYYKFAEQSYPGGSFGGWQG